MLDELRAQREILTAMSSEISELRATLRLHMEGVIPRLYELERKEDRHAGKIAELELKLTERVRHLESTDTRKMVGVMAALVSGLAGLGTAIATMLGAFSP